MICGRATKARLLALENALYVVADGTRFLLKQIAPLEKDISTIITAFSKEDVRADIPPARVSAFIKRVGAIAEMKSSAHVILKIDDGQIGLSFSDGLASSTSIISWMLWKAVT